MAVAGRITEQGFKHFKMNRIRWPKEEIERLDIPQSSKVFLIEHGLPQIVGCLPTVEFGVYDSDTTLVIGVCGEEPIVVKEPSGQVVLERISKPEMFLNSKVELLGAFIDLLSDQAIPTSSLEEEMATLDPRSIGSLKDTFWSQVVEDAEAMDD